MSDSRLGVVAERGVFGMAALCGVALVAQTGAAKPAGHQHGRGPSAGSGALFENTLAQWGTGQPPG